MSGELSGIATAVSLVAFLGVVGWAWSRHRNEDFERAAQLPLDEDQSADESAREQAR